MRAGLPSDRQPVASYFDGQATFWRDLYSADADVYAAIHRERREWALDAVSRVDLVEDTMVLDVGVGAGGLAVAVAATGRQVVGVDGSAHMLELTCAAADSRGTSKRVLGVQADAAALPFPDETFPVVMALGLVPWVSDPARVLREMARVAAPGGRLIVTADNANRLTHLVDPRFNPRLGRLRAAIGRWRGRSRSSLVRARGQTLHELHRMCQQAGLEVLECRPLGFGPFTFLGHHLLPGRVGLTLNTLLQRLARRGVPVLRSTSCQHLVLARRVA